MESETVTHELSQQVSQNPCRNSLTGSNESLKSVNPDQILTYGAKQIISLFIPVSICMFLVVIVASTVEFYAHTDQYLIYTPFHTPDADIGTQTWETVANTLIFMSVIVVMTCVLVLLFKYRCYKFIKGWLIMTTFFLLFLITFIFFTEVIRVMGIFVDYMTIAFLLWNFGIVGMISIHWYGPLFLQQAYLIFLSTQIALLFLKYLPKWTCWLVLAALAIWDLVAVLCPRGPLRILVELAHERQQPLFPALLYSTTAIYIAEKSRNSLSNEDLPNTNDNNTNISEIQSSPTIIPPLSAATTTNELITPSNSPNTISTDHELRQSLNNQVDVVIGSSVNSSQPRNRNSTCLNRNATSNSGQVNNESNHQTNRWREVQADIMDREERGVKLGLGDFVFYSLLIGRATLDGDAVTIITCYVAILVGMCLTIIVLGVTRRALPALPISITCGILFYFASSKIISPFLEAMAINRLFF